MSIFSRYAMDHGDNRALDSAQSVWSEQGDRHHLGTGPLLVVEGLHTGFELQSRTLKAVDGVSFSLDYGKTLAVVGESGSGKTVLCRSIMGLLPRSGVRTSGRVVLAGKDLNQLSPKELHKEWGRNVSMILQDPMTSLNPTVKIGRQIAESARWHLQLDRHQARRRSIDLLESVGIPSPEAALGRYPHQLSGGLRQRVAIASALACDPLLVLADEPTTALDVTIQAQILNLLDAEQAKRRMAMILITHDLGIVAGRADETMVMYAGRVVEKAPTRKLFFSPRMPYTRGLFDSLPRIHNPSHTLLPVIPGRPPDLASLGEGCSFEPRCSSAQPRCRTEAPPLVSGEDPEHLFACWYPVAAGTSAATSPMGAVGPVSS